MGPAEYEGLDPNYTFSPLEELTGELLCATLIGVDHGVVGIQKLRREGSSRMNDVGNFLADMVGTGIYHGMDLMEHEVKPVVKRLDAGAFSLVRSIKRNVANLNKAASGFDDPPREW